MPIADRRSFWYWVGLETETMLNAKKQPMTRHVLPVVEDTNGPVGRAIDRDPSVRNTRLSVLAPTRYPGASIHRATAGT